MNFKKKLPIFSRMFPAHVFNLLEKKKKEREKQNTLIRKKGNLYVTFLKHVK